MGLAKLAGWGQGSQREPEADNAFGGAAGASAAHKAAAIEPYEGKPHLHLHASLFVTASMT